MKKPAILAGFLGSALVAVLAAQHTVLAMELNSFKLGDIALTQEYQENKPQSEPEEGGEVLSAVTDEASAESEPEAQAAPEQVFVTVEKGDSLSKIAAAHNTTYKRLFNANESIADPNIINPGDQIRIPAADEVLADRPLPAPKPSPAPAPKAVKRSNPSPVQPSTAPAVASGSVWDRLAQCESGGNWHINTGNGYYGGLQFLPSTWRAVGGTGLPHQHSREEQIKRAEILLARSGWGQWPACTKKLGLR